MLQASDHIKLHQHGGMHPSPSFPLISLRISILGNRKESQILMVMVVMMLCSGVVADCVLAQHAAQLRCAVTPLSPSFSLYPPPPPPDFMIPCRVLMSCWDDDDDEWYDDVQLLRQCLA